jgi:hypothetical protein
LEKKKLRRTTNLGLLSLKSWADVIDFGESSYMATPPRHPRTKKCGAREEGLDEWGRWLLKEKKAAEWAQGLKGRMGWQVKGELQPEIEI